jgi:GTP cyclohydrolase II
MDDPLGEMQLTGHRRPSGAVRVAEATLPTRHGRFRAVVVEPCGGGAEFLALVCGDIAEVAAPLVRLHSECLTGDVLGSLRCDCGEQLALALDTIAAEGAGVLLYLPQEGRGVGLANKVRAYALQDRGADTVDANLALGLPVDGRDYADAAAALHALGVSTVRLLTNNPEKCSALEQHGVAVAERVALPVQPNPFNAAYLRTKRLRMGHLIGEVAGERPA